MGNSFYTGPFSYFGEHGGGLVYGGHREMEEMTGGLWIERISSEEIRGEGFFWGFRRIW
jgi:hypothetical protein